MMLVQRERSTWVSRRPPQTVAGAKINLRRFVCSGHRQPFNLGSRQYIKLVQDRAILRLGADDRVPFG